MKSPIQKRHAIDLVFPIALFFVFAASALVVLTLAASLYQDFGRRQQSHDEMDTPLTYISEKFRQNDTQGAIQIVDMDGIDCLSIPSEYDGTTFYTYIYVCENTMKELFVPEGTQVPLKSGTDIMPVQRLQMEEISPGLFRFITADREGKEVSLILSERSRS